MDDQKVVRGIYLGHRPWLLERLQRRLRNHAQAEDLTSEAFVQVVAHPDPGAIKEPRAFLTTIAKRLLFHFWRRQELEQAYLQSVAALPADTLPSAEDVALMLEALARVDRLLDGMTVTAKAAFLHSQVDGMTYIEIARRLEISQMSVRRYVAEGLRRCMAGAG
ncbi:MAG: hypothetical protein ABS43_10060 [Bordetella sp. SCN 67-23]|nr:sigma-70 family RNA polymerase sigma factor [Burkholderiales bacterium]ODS74411.1 MAG: hypothetical protein ABS43_10060 [Bordetella sp. SCN 67-23]ODU81869.1 MAG: hypothetical protein ABT00_11255 [Bordetella sp. SCN 68-11]OJW89734.1 MAG: hypothetical protein BGO71_20500 [Burkholderiales bacterium 67-32]